MKTLNFKSKASYKKWLAYGHMRTKSGGMATKRNNLFVTTPGNSRIKIRGKVHNVKHRR